MPHRSQQTLTDATRSVACQSRNLECWHYSYFQIDRPLAKKLHKADPERTTCGPQYFMMRVRTAVEPRPAASPITAEDVKLEVRISPPKSAPRDFFCEGPIDLKVAVKQNYAGH